MKRSEINRVIREAEEAFARHHWALPPEPKWDVTDFGLGDFDACGLTLINLAEEVEYCEKLMFAKKDQVTPRHHHRLKKEDIICRWGSFRIALHGGNGTVQVNGQKRSYTEGEEIILWAGERITLTSGIDHAFWPLSEYAIIGEVSTSNDDVNDNVFHDDQIGRFSRIEEDEAARVKLVGEE